MLNNKCQEILNNHNNNHSAILNKYPQFSYEVCTEIKNQINNNDLDFNAIINRIALWKLNRTIVIAEDLLPRIISLQDISSFEELIEKWNDIADLLNNLINRNGNCRGIRLPMASTIFHFYNPNIFPIIDRRAYYALFNTEFTDKMNKPIIGPNIYLEYILKCKEYYDLYIPNGEIEFSDIDKFLYMVDDLSGHKIKY